eukprot:scaffold228205_cov29-Tisochrysis_lutea.AAC.1
MTPWLFVFMTTYNINPVVSPQPQTNLNATRTKSKMGILTRKTARHPKGAGCGRHRASCWLARVGSGQGAQTIR